MYAAMDRDWDLDAVMAVSAPDAVWDLSAVGLGTYEGAAAIRELIETWAAWDEHHHRTEEIHDLGHPVCYVIVWEDGRPRAATHRSNSVRAGCPSRCRAR